MKNKKIFTSILLTVLWFVMGTGVANMWKRIIDDKFLLLIVVMWPLVLFVTAIIPVAKDT